MAATTVSEILARFEAVLQASPLSLMPAGDPFTSIGVAGSMVETTFRVVHGGQVHDKCQSNFSRARIDRLVVTVQRAMNFDGYQAQRDIQDQLDDIERAIIADGPDHSYMVHVEKGSRKVARLKNTDVIEAEIRFLCDYDFNEAAA